MSPHSPANSTSPHGPLHLPATPRRRGGQPGNVNRLKHGLYSRRLRPAVCGILDPRTGSNPAFELSLARVRLVRLIQQQQTASDRDWLSYERAILHYLGLISALLQAGARRNQRDPLYKYILDGLYSADDSPMSTGTGHSNLIRTAATPDGFTRD